MQDLIERLEKGPDRQLDIAIANACLPEHHSGRWSIVTAPAFTASIDAALTLVPEGWEWVLAHFADHPPSATVQFVGKGFHAAPDIEFDEHGKTAAIALCIAALKARMATSDACGQHETKA